MEPWKLGASPDTVRVADGLLETNADVGAWLLLPIVLVASSFDAGTDRTRLVPFKVAVVLVGRLEEKGFTSVAEKLEMMVGAVSGLEEKP